MIRAFFYARNDEEKLLPRHTMGHRMELRFFDRSQAVIARDLAARLDPVAAMGDTAAATFHARGEFLSNPAHAGSVAEMTTHQHAPRDSTSTTG